MENKDINNKIELELPSYVRKIIDVFEANHKNWYIVGGALRNHFLGLPIKDYDFATSLSVNELKELFTSFHIVNDNGLKHDTVSIYIDNEIVEITSFKHNKNEENCIEIDLSHRDFTINAMAYSFNDGLIDPFNGLKDLENKTLRFVKSSIDRIKEDPLRMLRFIRFISIYDFNGNEEDIKIINENAYRLKDIAKERIRSEFDQIIVGKNIKKVFLTFKNVFFTIFPELIILDGFNQNNKYHAHDVLTHTLNVLQGVPNDRITRIAALFHDIGKPACYSEEIKDGVICGHFYGHYEKGRDIVETILERLKYPSQEIEILKYLVFYHDFPLMITTKSVKRMLYKTPNNSLELFDKLIDLKISDHNDHLLLEPFDFPRLKELAREIIKEDSCLKVKDLAINGYDLLSLGFKGKEVGNILSELLNLIIEEKLVNEKNILISYVKENYKNSIN